MPEPPGRDMAMKSIEKYKNRKILNIFKYFCVIPFVTLLILLTVRSASSTALVFIDPVTTTVVIGSSFSIDVRIADVANLYGAEIELGYDSSILEATAIIPGDAPQPDFVVVSNIDNNLGVITYAVTQLAPTPPKTGDFVIAHINFKKITSGTTALDINSIVLSDPNGLPITVFTQGGVVEGATTVFIDPATTTVSIGSSLSIDVRIVDVADLYGAQIELKFDPSILEATAIIPGDAPEPDSIIRAINNNTGVIAFAVTQLAPTPPKTGDFVIAHINFNTITYGIATVNIKNMLLFGPDGTPITVSTQGGIIEVEKKPQGKILWLALPAILNPAANNE